MRHGARYSRSQAVNMSLGSPHITHAVCCPITLQRAVCVKVNSRAQHPFQPEWTHHAAMLVARYQPDHAPETLQAPFGTLAAPTMQRMWHQQRQQQQLIACQSSPPPASYLLEQLLSSPQQRQELLNHHPELLEAQLSTWVDFLGAYGLEHKDISKLLLACPELFTTSSVYDTGRTLLFFKGLGWQDADILNRIVPYYPGLLGKQLERDIHPVLAHLAGLGCSAGDIKLLVWEYPRIFCRDYRRHIKKFQYLGLYGLPAPGSSKGGGKGASSSGGMDSLQRLMFSVH